jgi:hypothetical protein
MPRFPHHDFLDRILAEQDAVLEYDSETKGLRTWPW